MILGCFVDGVAMILLTIPVVYPVAHALHIDLIHLGIMMTLTVEMSLVTPPVGLNLFAVSGVSKIPVSEVVKGSMPFFCTDALVLLAVVFWPGACHLAAGPAGAVRLQVAVYSSGSTGRTRWPIAHMT